MSIFEGKNNFLLNAGVDDVQNTSIWKVKTTHQLNYTSKFSAEKAIAIKLQCSETRHVQTFKI